MDTLITLLLIVFAVSKFFAKSKKTGKPAQKRNGSYGRPAEGVYGQANKSSDFRTVSQTSTFRPQTAHSPFPENRTQSVGKRDDSFEGQSMQQAYMSQVATSSTEGKSGYGTVSPGSLMDISTEGMDICDPVLGHDDHSIGCEPHAVMKPLDDFGESGTSSIDLSWNSENLVRAVVMNEILTRPSERFVRRG